MDGKLKDVKKFLTDTRGKTAAQLQDELLKLRREQFALRMQRATGQGAKPDQFNKTRKAVARLKTVQRQQALAGVKK